METFYGQKGEKREMVVVDTFVPHAKLEEVIRRRQGHVFQLVAVLPCVPKDGVDYATLIWDDSLKKN